MTKLKSLKKPVNKNLVVLLEALLDRVKDGNVQGIVVLMNTEGVDYSFASAGDMAMSEVLNVFGQWEFDQRMSQWTETNRNS